MTERSGRSVAALPSAEAVAEAYGLLCGLVIDEAGTTWGEVAEGFQRDDALAVLRGDRWTLLCRGRGMSKTGDVAALLLVLLIVMAPRRARGFVYACDQDQAAELLDAIGGYVERTEGLAGTVSVTADRVTVKRSGARLRIEPSDGASAFGRNPWVIVADELSLWGEGPNARRLWSAIVSSLPKVKGARFLTMMTGGDPSHWAYRAYVQAQSSGRWHCSTTPGPAPWWDPGDTAAAVELMTPAEVSQLIHCEWVSDESSLTSPEDVAAAVMAGVMRVPFRRGVRYCAGLDIGVRRDRTAVSVCHSEPGAGGGRRVVTDAVLWWKAPRGGKVSLEDVRAALLVLWREYGRPVVVYDKHQGEHLVELLTTEGVRCEEYVFSVSGVDRLARTMMVLLRDRRLGLLDIPELVEEVAAVRIVETTSGLVKLQNQRGRFDDMTTATALAATWLLDRSVAGPASAGAAKGLLRPPGAAVGKIGGKRRWLPPVAGRK